MPQLPQIDSVKAPDKIVAQATRARRFPWLNIPFILVVALLVSYGLVVVMSAVANDRDYSFTNQLAGVALGIVFMVLVWRFDYRRLSDFTMLFLIVNVALILSPHIPGLGTDAGMGAQSWLKLGIQVQPGEFAKITVILLDAVKTGAPPGTVVTRSRDELPRHFSLVISPHQIGMKEVLGAAQLCGTLPRIITLVGVEAGHTDFCQPMSAEVREAVPQALDLVETLIARALEEYQARKDAHA